jgi:hypothetical protein
MKMKRPLVILLTGGLLLVSCYQLLPIALGSAETIEESDSSYDGNARSNGLAPLLVWTDMWGGAFSTEQGQKKDYWKAIKAEKILVFQGLALVNDEVLPTKTIKNYLNQKVLNHEISYVAIFTDNDTKIGELFPIIDECRKSDVKTVLLNFDIKRD